MGGFLETWLPTMRGSLRASTYASYEMIVTKRLNLRGFVVMDYYKENDAALAEL